MKTNAETQSIKICDRKILRNAQVSIAKDETMRHLGALPILVRVKECAHEQCVPQTKDYDGRPKDARR